ncbi:MAG TPA: protein-disulfide reductase DsbD domain-containing protein, partial [Tepidisphaeraceae bacterium]|nr:protein-disulfide reductase DsbD domain-containing protein [Tepidisphaeraceae bacterium]
MTKPAALLATFLILMTGAMAQARSHADVTVVLNVSALQPGKSAVLAVITTIQPGLHSEPAAPATPTSFAVSLDSTAGVQFGPPQYPPSVVRMYADLGALKVYVGKVVTYVPIQLASDVAPGTLHLSGKVRLQACTDTTGQCYLPESVPFALDAPVVASDETVAAANQAIFKDFKPAPSAATRPTTIPTATQPAAAVTNGMTSVSLLGHSFDLENEPIPVIAAIAFLAGIIFNLMPCVLPVLPPKAIGFYEVAQHHRAKTLLLGFVFSCGLVAVFAALGGIILGSKFLFGHQIAWGVWFSYPAFVWGIAILLALLGIGMLGAFSLRLPAAIYGLNFRHDTMGGNFMWG